MCHGQCPLGTTGYTKLQTLLLQMIFYPKIFWLFFVAAPMDQPVARAWPGPPRVSLTGPSLVLPAIRQQCMFSFCIVWCDQDWPLYICYNNSCSQWIIGSLSIQLNLELAMWYFMWPWPGGGQAPNAKVQLVSQARDLDSSFGDPLWHCRLRLRLDHILTWTS